MPRPLQPTPSPTLRRCARTAAAALLGLTTLGAVAQGLDTRRIGLGLGSSDYGTAIKGQWSEPLQPPFGRGDWRWEAQAVHFGSSGYQQFGNDYRHSAWSLGASAVAQLPLERGLVGHGKLGLHYLHSQATGPGLDARRNGLKVGVGMGAMWRATPSLGIKLEYEVIGGSHGDVVSIGAELPW